MMCDCPMCIIEESGLFDLPEELQRKALRKGIRIIKRQYGL